RLRDVELGELLDDVDLLELRLVGELVAESHAIVEHPEYHDELAATPFIERGAHFGAVIAHIAPLTPRLLPGVVETALRHLPHFEVALEFWHVRENESEARPVDDDLRIALDAVFGPAIAIDTQVDEQHLSRRSHARHRRHRLLRQGPASPRRQRHDDRNGSHHSRLSTQVTYPSGGMVNFTLPGASGAGQAPNNALNPRVPASTCTRAVMGDVDVLKATSSSRPSFPMREAANNPGSRDCARTTCRPRGSSTYCLRNEARPASCLYSGCSALKFALAVVELEPNRPWSL